MPISKCPGQDNRNWRSEDVFDVPCPSCGKVLEFWKTEAARRCKACGRRVTNPHFNAGCAAWCEHAADCLGLTVQDGACWVERLFQAIDAKDIDAFCSFLADDVRFRFGSSPPVEGKQQVRQAVTDFLGTLSGVSHRLIQVWTETGAFICEGEATYTLPDGRKVTLPFLNVFRPAEPPITDYRIYIDMSPLAGCLPTSSSTAPLP